MTDERLKELSESKWKLPLRTSSTKFAVATIENKDGEQLCEFDLIEDFYVANEIVKRVNAYDDLINLAKLCTKDFISETNWINVSQEAHRLLKELENA